LNTNDGGPAFPVPLAATQNASGDPILYDATERCVGGMTLRDYFAGQALTGMCSVALEDGELYPPTYQAQDFEPWPDGKPDDVVWFEQRGNYLAVHRSGLWKQSTPLRLISTYYRVIAREAYQFADAMLAERAKTTNQST